MFLPLWEYRNTVKITTGFTPFQLAYIIEVVFPIECEIPYLKLAIELLPNTLAEEEQFVYLTNLDEMHWDPSLANESHKKCVKAQYDKSIQPRVFNERDIVLIYDQKHEKLGKGKFESMWYGPYVISRVLEKGAYEIMDYDGIPFGNPRNGIYLKRCYA